MNLLMLLIPVCILLVLLIRNTVAWIVDTRAHEIMVTSRFLKIRQQFEILRQELPVAQQTLAQLSLKNPPQVTQVLQEKLQKIDLAQLEKVYTKTVARCTTSFQKKEEVSYELVVLEALFENQAKIIGEAIQLPNTVEVARQESMELLASLPEYMKPTEIIIVHDSVSLETKNQFRSAVQEFQTARIQTLDPEKTMDWIMFLATIKKMYATFQTIHAYAVVERGYVKNTRPETIAPGV